MIASMLAAALAVQPPAAPPQATSKEVAPVTVTATPRNAPPADIKITIGSDADQVGSQDVLIWPAGAREAGLSGEVTLSCRIDVHGLAEWCRVVAESPAGRRFGKAALALRPVLKVAPKRDVAGNPTDAT